MGERKARLPQVLFAAFAILAPAAVGGYLGCVADIPYGTWLRLALGAAAGCYMGGLWLLAMRLVMKKESAGRIVAAGAVYGMLAGFMATIVFHLVLGIITASGRLAATFDHAFLFGMPAGFVTGLVCGYAAAWAAAWNRSHG